MAIRRSTKNIASAASKAMLEPEGQAKGAGPKETKRSDSTAEAIILKKILLKNYLKKYLVIYNALSSSQQKNQSQ